jgi:hypothetical protein
LGIPYIFYADKWEFHGSNDSFMAVSKKQRANYKEVKNQGTGMDTGT